MRKGLSFSSPTPSFFSVFSPYLWQVVAEDEKDYVEKAVRIGTSAEVNSGFISWSSYRAFKKTYVTVEVITLSSRRFHRFEQALSCRFGSTCRGSSGSRMQSKNGRKFCSRLHRPRLQATILAVRVSSEAAVVNLMMKMTMKKRIMRRTKNMTTSMTTMITMVIMTTRNTMMITRTMSMMMSMKTRSMTTITRKMTMKLVLI